MEIPATAIILFAHGSAVADANRQVQVLADQVGLQAGCTAVSAFLEIAQPDLAAATAALVDSGAQRIVVVPYFLSMGVHVSKDLPRLIAEQQRKFPSIEIFAGQPLEGSPRMPELILDRVKEALENAS